MAALWQKLCQFCTSLARSMSGWLLIFKSMDKRRDNEWKTSIYKFSDNVKEHIGHQRMYLEFRCHFVCKDPFRDNCIQSSTKIWPSFVTTTLHYSIYFKVKNTYFSICISDVKLFQLQTPFWLSKLKWKIWFDCVNGRTH